MKEATGSNANADAAGRNERVVMRKNCHTCRYHLEGESNPYARCLHFYNKGNAIEALKSGLIGECDEYKPIDA